MVKLFKSLGMGLFIVLTSPLWLLAYILMLVLLVFKYIIGEILSVIYFFRGYNYLEDDMYDIALEEVMDENEQKQSTQQRPIYVQAVPEKYIDPRFFKDNLDEEEVEEDE